MGIASLFDVQEIEKKGVPSDLPKSTYDAIVKGCEIGPSAPALSFFMRTEDHRAAETWTYSEFLARITETANFLHSLGANRDTVIAYVLPNLPETHWALWGAEAAGIALAINPLLEEQAIADILNCAKATIIITTGPFPGVDLWSKVQRAILQSTTLKHVVLVNLADRVAGFKGIFAHAMSAFESLKLHGVKGAKGAVGVISVHDFNSSIEKQNSSKLISNRIILAEDYSSYFCTGGTTGQPKIAMRRHLNEVFDAWSASQFLGDGIGPGKNIFCGLPLFHCNGALVTGLLPFSKGAHVVLGTPQGYRGEGVVKRFWEIVEQHKISFFSGVPTLYASLLDVPINGRNVNSLEYGLCGAAPMPVEVFRNFQDRTGLKILEGYGLTEGTCVSSVNPALGERRIGSIGLRIPAQQMKTVILDGESNYERDCQNDEIGALLISGPNVFAGYMLPPQNDKIFLEGADGIRWFNTGDLARQDSEGYFWLTGRKKELIIRGGHNIDPAIIEETLQQHPAVQIAAAIGRPDAYAGELPVAYIQLRTDATVKEDELMSFVKAKIVERAATPKYIRLMEQMPLTAVGKIFKPALKKLEIEDALKTALADAGITIQKLTATADDRDGFIVSVTVKEASQVAAARQVLGAYSLHCTVTDSFS